MKTTVIQSYRTKNVPNWIQVCLQCSHEWATQCGYAYRFIGDEILDIVPDWYIKNTGYRWPVITDLGRLILIRDEFINGADRVIWLDADVLIFNAKNLTFENNVNYAFGREYWVQFDKDGSALKLYRNVHNAICLFKTPNSFLEFYIDACKKIISGASGTVPNQVVGTKFLTALHNIIGFNLIESVAMTSPLVLRDIVAGNGPALNLLLQVTKLPVGAANLCSSLVGGETDGVDITETFMMTVCDILLKKGITKN